jgi:UDP-GlcNAc3NAcA epimerase
MNLLTVVGTRPQIIKSVLVSQELRKHGINEIVVNTGQHYDFELSSIFYEEFKLSDPDYNLGIGSGTHAEQLAKILLSLENIVLSESPNAILVYGDTNSTLGAALTAAKLNIPLIHVESGLRSFDKKMPEEINRFITDHLANLLLCTGDIALQNLYNESIKNNVIITGDVMYDVYLHYQSKITAVDFNEVSLKFNLVDSNIIEENYVLMTLHRNSLVNDLHQLKSVLEEVNKLKIPVIFPIHPNTKERIRQLSSNYVNICFLAPLGYYDMLTLTKFCNTIITDSGGLMREAYFAKKRMIVIRENTEFPEIFESSKNAHLIYNNLNEIHRIITHDESENAYSVEDHFGDGKAHIKISKAIIKFFEKAGSID